MFNKSENRSIAYDNEIIIGECRFTEKQGKWNIVHTEVNRDYQGKGIARMLVKKVMENATKYNVKVIATCEYARKILM